MPNLVLIQPSYENNRLYRNARTIYPLGLAYLAAYVPDRWQVATVDEQLREIDYDVDADLVGISTTTLTANACYRIAARFRRRGVQVVLGGVHASMVPEEALRFCDAVCIGDGEHVIADMLADFESCGLKRRYVGPLQPLEELRLPRHELFERQRYSFLPISTSRGCPFNCTFCSINEFYGGSYRLREVGSVMEELRKLPRGSDVAFFTDGNMYGYSRKAARRFREMCRAFIRERRNGGLPFNYFTCYGSVNALADEAALDLAAEAGCIAMLVGFESINPDSLREMKKTLNLKYGPESYFQLVRNAQQRGILVVGEMIVGSDADDETVLRDTAAFIERVRFDLLRLQILQPLPGTSLFNTLQAEGRLHLRRFPEDWDRLAEGFLAGVHYDLKKLGTRQLQRWVKEVGLAYYAPLKITRRALESLLSTRSVKMLALSLAMQVKSRKSYANLRLDQFRPASSARRATGSP